MECGCVYGDCGAPLREQLSLQNVLIKTPARARNQSEDAGRTPPAPWGDVFSKLSGSLACSPPPGQQIARLGVIFGRVSQELLLKQLLQYII